MCTYVQQKLYSLQGELFLGHLVAITRLGCLEKMSVKFLAQRNKNNEMIFLEMILEPLDFQADAFNNVHA